jgi:Domain of unknown function (DUF4397)
MKISFSSVRTHLFLAGGVLMGGLLLSACNKLHDDNNGNGNTPASGLMAFNLAPDKPAVQVALSGSALTNDALAYGSYTGNYLAVYTGTRNVEAYDNVGSPFASTPYNFEPNKYYSAFVVGAGGNYENVVVNDKFDSLSVASGEAYVRYINAIPDSGAAPLVTISANGTNVSSANAAFKTVSDFTAVTPGDVKIEVSNGGTINANRTISLETKKAYTVLLVGRPSSTGPDDSVQIKFITNGALSDSTAARTSSSARATISN